MAKHEVSYKEWKGSCDSKTSKSTKLECDINRSRTGVKRHLVEGGSQCVVETVHGVHDYNLLLMREMFDSDNLKSLISGSGDAQRINDLANCLIRGAFVRTWALKTILLSPSCFILRIKTRYSLNSSSGRDLIIGFLCSSVFVLVLFLSDFSYLTRVRLSWPALCMVWSNF